MRKYPGKAFVFCALCFLLFIPSLSSSADPPIIPLAPSDGQDIDEDDFETGPPSPPPVLYDDALGIINRAVLAKKITLREAVLLKAKLLFVPETVALDSKAHILEGVTTFKDPCTTGFYKDVHKVFDQLTEEDKVYLRSLNENLRVIIQNRERKQLRLMAPLGITALPDFGLTLSIEGTTCTVNFTDTGIHSTTVQYATLVQQHMDNAFDVIGMKFRDALPETGGTDDKLQVYIMDSSSDGTWIDSTVISPTAKGYIIISNSMVEAGQPKESQIKGTCFHEYFHGVQSAYRYDSDLWFLEGTATWAQMFYGGSWDSLPVFLNDSYSVIVAPNRPIWEDIGLRKYSTVALAYYFSDRFGGDNFIQSYFQKSVNEPDAIFIMTQLITETKKATFNNEFVKYLAAIFQKEIASIKPYMPTLGPYYEYHWREAMDNSSFDCSPFETYQLGAVYTVFKPTDEVVHGSVPKIPLGYQWWPVGDVEMFQFTNLKAKPKAVKEVPDSDTYYWISKFGKKVNKLVLIATSLTYTGQDHDPREACFGWSTPWVNVRPVPQPEPRCTNGWVGLWQSVWGSRYCNEGSGECIDPGVTMKLTGRGPGGYTFDYHGDDWLDDSMNIWFQPHLGPTPGKYKFTYVFSSPTDTLAARWGIPQIRSKAKYSVTVRECN